MSHDVYRLKYEKITWFPFDLADFIADFSEPFKSSGQIVYVDNDFVDEIRTALKENKKKELIEEFEEWVSAVGKKRIKEGFDLVIIW
jgi:hypothetical protein